ncbi:MAG: glycosyltransferase family 2 protein [Thermoprotei archaeon]
MDEPLVSIVIPTHNRREKLARLINSILESEYPKDKLEIIVVDDASTDGTHKYVKKLFPQVKVIRNSDEKLLAESRNIGIRVSRGKYIFIIDDDNVVDRNTIKELVEYMEKHPEAGVAGPIMYFLSDPDRVWCAGVKRNYWTTITKLIGFNTKDNGQFKKPYESEDFPNAFMVRREVFEKVGLLNSELFPIHYDEADFCQRVRRAGYKVMVVPSAKVWHDIPLPEQGRASILHLKSSLRAYYASRNRFIFHWKWSRNMLQRIVALMASLVVTLYYMVAVVRDQRITDKHVILSSILRGVADAFRIIGGEKVRSFEHI